METLSKDFYRVFKSVTNYSYIEYDDILKELGLTHKALTKLRKERLFDIQEFRKFKKKKFILIKKILEWFKVQQLVQ